MAHVQKGRKYSLGTGAEREEGMKNVLRGFYRNPANAGKDMSFFKANEEFKKDFRTMIRNKVFYPLRAEVKREVLGGGKKKSAATQAAAQPVSAGRNPHTVNEGASGGACLIQGTPEQIAFLKTALGQLGPVAGMKVDHESNGYVVLVKA